MPCNNTAGLGNPSHYFAVILNADGSLDSSIYLDKLKLGTDCAPVRQGKGLACTMFASKDPTVTVVDLESKSAKVFSSLGPAMSSITLADDGWIVDSSLVGIQGVSMESTGSQEAKVEIFNLEGKSIAKVQRTVTTNPTSRLYASDLTVYSSARSLVDRDDAYTSRLTVDKNGTVVAQDFGGATSKDQYKIIATGKKYDGYIHLSSSDGQTFVVSPKGLDTVNLAIKNTKGKEIQTITLVADSLAKPGVVSGIMYYDTGHRSDQKLTIFVPKN